MAAEQDWCVQCGTNPSRSMRVRASWYSAGALLALSAILASGAAAAGIAALTQGGTKEPAHRELALQSPPSTPPTTPPATSRPVNPGKPETLKLPRRAGTGVLITRSRTSTSASASAAAEATTRSESTSTSGETSSSETSSASAEPIELQGSQLSNYDPHNSYPTAALNNPKQAYEEAESVLWSVKVQPAGAHKIGVGLLIELGSASRIATIEVRTQTPGFALEVLGAAQAPVPGKRSSNRWIKLGSAKAIKATEIFHISERTPIRYVLLWVKSVPPSLAGSAAEPGRLKLEEVAIFPGS
jgi:hypothetical protein